MKERNIEKNSKKVKIRLVAIICIYREVLLLNHRVGQCSHGKDTAIVFQSDYIHSQLHKLCTSFQLAHIMTTPGIFHPTVWPSGERKRRSKCRCHPEAKKYCVCSQKSIDHLEFLSGKWLFKTLVIFSVYVLINL